MDQPDPLNLQILLGQLNVDMDRLPRYLLPLPIIRPNRSPNLRLQNFDLPTLTATAVGEMN